MSHLLAFTAVNFEPCHASSFLLGYGQMVLLEKKTFRACLEQILPSSYPLSRQTDLVHIHNPTGKRPIGFRFSWVHDEIRPWGNELPVQCRCGRVRNWVFSKLKGNCIFSCKHHLCEERLVFSPPEKLEWVGIGITGGRWLVKDLYLVD
jgi:hypothetical protein